jgi:hypothetical protein
MQRLVSGYGGVRKGFRDRVDVKVTLEEKNLERRRAVRDAIFAFALTARLDTRRRKPLRIPPRFTWSSRTWPFAMIMNFRVSSRMKSM